MADSPNPPKRRRRRRGSSHAQKGEQKQSQKRQQKHQKQPQKSQKQQPNKRRRKQRPQNYRKPHTSQYTTDHKMETRDETSAGGLVVSGMAEAVAADGSVDLSRIYVALIGRLDRRGRLLWSMPKGHVEPGEHQWDTARREVWEETGIYGEPFEDLGLIDYWFVSDGVRIHKTVHHNLLRYVDGVLNDEDPEVTEVAWVPVSELMEHLAYADERKLARIAFDKMPALARAEKRAGRITPR
ncbi:MULTISPECIES: NUDIX hydrolase [unclassified Corynebacterium]|uniref:NUDIX hydrolase n=1 Tax=unclassified Corynebacterium TaxID=2624378 RepID=UPI00210B89E5|nr:MULTISPECIES: NUDIX hydrolase [unclassified Corynebacterium]